MKKLMILMVAAALLYGCRNKSVPEQDANPVNDPDTNGDSVNLPAPFATPSVTNNSKIIGWPAGKTPQAPEGFVVTSYATGFNNARWIYVADNGDVFIAESGANRITLLRDANADGIPETRTSFLNGLNQPLGMLIIGDKFYVANTNGVVTFPYKPGQTGITETGTSIVSLPSGAGHWTRNIVTNAAKNKLYIAVGSSSNVAENGIDKETRRANILEVNLDGSGEKIYASGLRNPVGMDWAPGTSTLWTSVNERDALGDDLVPDFMTGVKEGGFYGWPYSYFGQHEDPRMKDKNNPELVKKAIVPDVALGSHTASLGLAFYTGTIFPIKYQGGAFVGQHGSWNRSVLNGYKVAFVPFSGGKPSGKMEDFLTGFISNASASEVFGRPVGVAVAKDGSLLVADDGANIIWRVSKK